MSYQNYEWEVIASDYNSPFFRNSFWVQSWFEQARILGISRVVIGIYSKGQKMEYIVDKGAVSWINAHNDFKAQVLNDALLLERHIDKTNQKGEEMNDWTQKNIFDSDISILSGKELFDLETTALEKIATLYAYGTILPVLDFQGFSFVEGNLEKILHKYVDDEYERWFEIFTAPIKSSFSQDQEMDLLRLYAEYFSHDEWKKDVQTKSLFEIQVLYPDFVKKLEEHTAKHGWVYYVYAGPAFSKEQFFEFIIHFVQQGIDPIKKLQEIENRKRFIESEKTKFFELYKVTEFEKNILLLAGKMVWAKPRRKDYQSKSYYHIEKIQKEMAKRLGMTLKQVRSCPREYLQEALEEKEFDYNVPNVVFEAHICLPNDDGSLSILYGNEAEEFSSKIIRHQECVETNKKEIQGTCACPGTGSGVVRIINIPEDMNKMNVGDILVSTATTPSIVGAMKKASAIVTDEGGLTCHAAIVSRELGIPCVIGTKIATRVLKDGDLVEVDASEGVIKILS